MNVSAFLLIYISVVTDLPGFEELFARAIEAVFMYYDAESNEKWD